VEIVLPFLLFGLLSFSSAQLHHCISPHSSPAGCAFTFYAVVLTLLEWVQECILALAS